MKQIARFAAASLAAFAGSAAAYDPVGDAPWTTAYLSIPFDGANREQRKPSFGISVVRSDAAAAHGTAGMLTAPRLADARFQDGALQTLTLNRQTFLYRDEAGRLNAFGDLDDPLTWAAAGAAAVVVACLAEWGICEDDRNRGGGGGGTGGTGPT